MISEPKPCKRVLTSIDVKKIRKELEEKTQDVFDEFDKSRRRTRADSKRIVY